MIPIAIDIYITNQDYQKDRFFYSMKLSNGDIEESKEKLIELNIIIIIPDNDNQHLSILLDLEVKKENK